MLDLSFAVAGGLFLLGAVLLALAVDRDEVRRAAEAEPWSPTERSPVGTPARRLQLIRLDP